MFLPAKLRISEQNTKFIWIFSNERLRSHTQTFRSEKLLAERKDSANRTKNQNYLEFFSFIWSVHFFYVLLHIKTE